MNKHIVGLNKKYSISLVISFMFLLLTVLPVPAFSETCIHMVDNEINVDGIVVGTKLVGGLLPQGSCPVDPGWAGVIHQDFTLFDDNPGSANPAIFLAGYNSDSDSNPEKIYVGVHVEDDPTLDHSDKFALYIDVNGTGSEWEEGDIAVIYYNEIIPYSVTTDPYELCDQPTGMVQFMRYSAGAWGSVDLSSNVANKVAWDYCNVGTCDTGDEEVWELEISLDVDALGLTANSGEVGFKLGAKLAVYDDTIPGHSVWKWPAGLTSVSYPEVFAPNNSENDISPNTLEPLSFKGDCYDVIFTPDDDTCISTTAGDTAGTSNAIRLYDDGDFDAAGNLMTGVNPNHFTANLLFYNPSNSTDETPIVNNGNVKFYIRPWSLVTNDFMVGDDKYAIETMPANFTHFGQEIAVEFFWPLLESNYDSGAPDHQPKTHLKDSHHSCFKVELEGFTYNMHLNNDVRRRNLTYVPNSTVKDTILISAPKEKPAPGTDTLEIVLRVNSRNVPQDLLDPKFERKRTSPQAKTRESLKKRDIAAYSNDARVQISDRGKSELDYEYEKWNFSFPNADKIGLRSMGNGYYSLRLKPGEYKKLDIELKGGEMPPGTLKYTLKVPAKAGESILDDPNGTKPVDIKVEAGNIVTFITHGWVKMEPGIKTVGPNGFSDTALKNAEFLLARGYYEPSQRIGALIGSFDGFKTAFVLGADKTIVVPEDAANLSLAVNEKKGGYADNTGDGFQVHVIITGRLKPPTRMVTPGNKKWGIPDSLRAGSNLPIFNIDAYQVVPVKERAGKKAMNILKPTGYVAYGVYESHPRKIYKHFELTLPFVGWTFFNNNLALKNGPVVGAKLGYRFVNYWTLEAEAGFGFTEDTLLRDKGNWLQLMANLRFRLPILNPPWSMDLTAGAGVLLFRGLAVNDEAFALKGGWGLTYKFSSSFGLRFDARALHLSPVFSAPATTNFQATGGLVFWF